MKGLILWFLCCLISLEAAAQLPPACQPGQLPADDCSNACIYCDFNGYSGNTAGYTVGVAENFCGSIENEQWLGFIAGANAATFTATPINCSNGDGLQIALYSTCSGNPIACDSGEEDGGNFPVSLNNVSITPGSNYYLVVDGFGGDQCTFSITVDPPTAVMVPPISSIGPIQGPALTCPGAVPTYSIPVVQYAAAYTWTVPSDWLINGLPSPQQILSGNGGNSVQLTVGASGGDICVLATNSCDPVGASTCLPVAVQPIPKTIVPEVFVCSEDSPYTLPWGDQISVSGTYQAILSSYLGCDSLVEQKVTMKLPLETTLPPQFICAGGFVSICGVEYDTPGSFSQICTSYQGCDSVVNFTLELLSPTAEIQGAATLNCSTSSITLTAAASHTGTSFNWKNASGQFLSFSDSLVVSTPNTYILTATLDANGLICINEDTVVIGLNTTAPSIMASSDVLTCLNDSIPISTITDANLPIWQWTGPGGFSDSSAMPIVTDAGTYALTLTNGLNGCTSTATAQVDIDTIAPSVVVTANDFVTCLAPSVNIQTNVVSPSPVVDLFWVGPNNYNNTNEDPLVTAGGLYSLTVIAQNGCSTVHNVDIQEDTAVPDIVAQGSTITCADTVAPLLANSQTLGLVYAWSGPNNFMSMDDSTSTLIAGVYAVTVTSQNGCTASDSTVVDLDLAIPNAAAVSSNDLNCTLLSTDLIASSQTDSVSFWWTGPNAFTDSSAMTVAGNPGIYQVIIIAANGCTSSSSVVVMQDVIPPGAMAQGGEVDCINGQLDLLGTANSPGASYSWTGPNGFSSSLQNPTITTLGNYILTVTGLNGCVSIDSALVLGNSSAPVVSLSGADTLNCIATDLLLSAVISTPGATGVWSGPGNFSSTNANINISIPGDYMFTVTAQNGCITAPVFTVIEDIVSPQDVLATGVVQNCLTSTDQILAQSSSPGVSYQWSGPGNFSSMVQNPSVTDTGFYTVIVSNNANGCTASATVLVSPDPTIPNVTIQADSLTCNDPVITLDANSSSQGTIFQWSGPNGFSSSLEDPSTTTAGFYTVVAQAQSGCTASASFTVGQNIMIPNIAATGDTLSCTQVNGQIIGTSNTAGLVYAWSGPGGFTSSLPNPFVNIFGQYQLTVTALNGCTASAAVEVLADTIAPMINGFGAIINCFNPTVSLSANANTNVMWHWTGPANFNATVSNPSTSVPGLYTLSARAANGCTSTLSVTVQDDRDAPDVSTEIPDDLDCMTNQVGLSAQVLSPGQFTYQWSTQNGAILSGANSLAPQVTMAGLYTLVVSNLNNGCTTSTNVTVKQDSTAPSGAFFVEKPISCFGEADGALRIDSVQGGVPPFLYSIDHEPFTSATNFTSIDPGSHDLLIQDVNGCELLLSFFIDEPLPFSVDLGPDTIIHLGQTIVLSLDNITTEPNRVVQTIILPAALILPDTLTPVESFSYQVILLDSNGCRTFDERSIIVERDRWVYIPNIFKPNSTENNLLLVYGGIDVAAVKTFLVFDRWGNAVHEYLNFQPNDPAAAWDGRYKGQLLNPAVFVYFAEVLFKDGETKVFKGDVTLFR